MVNHPPPPIEPRLLSVWVFSCLFLATPAYNCGEFQNLVDSAKVSRAPIFPIFALKTIVLSVSLRDMSEVSPQDWKIAPYINQCLTCGLIDRVFYAVWVDTGLIEILACLAERVAFRPSADNCCGVALGGYS